MVVIVVAIIVVVFVVVVDLYLLGVKPIKLIARINWLEWADVRETSLTKEQVLLTFEILMKSDGKMTLMTLTMKY